MIALNHHQRLQVSVYFKSDHKCLYMYPVVIYHIQYRYFPSGFITILAFKQGIKLNAQYWGFSLIQFSFQTAYLTINLGKKCQLRWQWDNLLKAHLKSVIESLWPCISVPLILTSYKPTENQLLTPPHGRLYSLSRMLRQPTSIVGKWVELRPCGHLWIRVWDLIPTILCVDIY